jgi:hypothetical protein
MAEDSEEEQSFSEDSDVVESRQGDEEGKSESASDSELSPEKK